MTDFIWYRHDDLDTVVQQPKDARAQLAQSGWFPLSDKDVAAHEQAIVDAVAADEKALTANVAKADEDPPAAETPTKAPPRGKTSTKESE